MSDVENYVAAFLKLSPEDQYQVRRRVEAIEPLSSDHTAPRHRMNDFDLQLADACSRECVTPPDGWNGSRVSAFIKVVGEKRINLARARIMMTAKSVGLSLTDGSWIHLSQRLAVLCREWHCNKASGISGEDAKEIENVLGGVVQAFHAGSSRYPLLFGRVASIRDLVRAKVSAGSLPTPRQLMLAFDNLDDVLDRAFPGYGMASFRMLVAENPVGMIAAKTRKSLPAEAVPAEPDPPISVVRRALPPEPDAA